MLAALPGLLIPAWFWLAQTQGWPLWPAGFLLLPLAWQGGHRLRLPRWVMLGMATMGLGAILLRNEVPVLFYPVLVNALFLCLFGLSLRSGQSAVERLARLQEPDLPPAAIAYTRRVTQVWCVFFLFNGLVALWTTQQDRMIWAVYNGAIAYLLIGLMFAGEWLVRKKVRNSMHD